LADVDKTQRHRKTVINAGLQKTG